MSADFLEKEVVYINSADRIHGNSHNFSVDLSQQLKVPNNYDYASLLAFSCPKSYYLFNSGNNVFYVDENGAITTITIPIGNYSFSSLTNSLTVLLAACVWDYTVENNIQTGRFEFTVTGNGGIQPIMDFSGDESPHAIMGFEKESYAFAANELESVNIVNFQTTSTIEVACDFVRNSILSVIIPNNTDFSTINYNEYNVSYASQPLSRSNFASASFSLIDGRTGTLLDLNGLNCNFTIVFYKKNNYYQSMLIDRKNELEIQQLQDEYNQIIQQLG